MSGRVVIVGGGIAGLTLALKLAQAGREVQVVEREPVVGGLARSFRYGDFVFDIGPHRFHTDVPETNAFIREILGEDSLEIDRRSGVWMFGRYFDWPLTARSILKMPYSTLLKTGFDLLFGKSSDCRNFEEYVTSKYGRTLYNIFFKPYTEKFLGIPCSEISSDWAVTGIERAVIDKGIESGDLGSFARSILTTSSRMKFIYPKSGGIGRFSEYLVRGIEELGGEVCTGAEVEQLIVDQGKVAKVVVNGREAPCDLLVWTAPPPQLLQMLGRGTTDLEYLPLLLLNYEVEGEPLMDYQWCYFGDERIPFNRVSIPARFNPALAPPGKTGICVEVTSSSKSVSDRVESLDRAVRKGLVEVGLVAGEDAITGVHVEKVPNAYPLYRLNYQNEFQKTAAIVAEYGNIELLGRTGSFWYNNMDHSIEAALDLALSLEHVYV